ncbi:MAG TPA: hypothetical protein VJR27_03365 [Candidatus Saccharimonadales bacterium]|nr:hypothetical protein [Candidatus Saccharimonadales bacterium]
MVKKQAQPQNETPARAIAVFVYVLLAALVMLPLFKPGYVLTVDLVFTPKIPLPDSLSASYPFWAVLHFINILVQAQIIEKALLFAVLVLAGFGAHSFVEKLQAKSADGLAGRWAAYFAGVFYMFNPFVYSRFMAGQFMVLLGYALIPFFAAALWQFCKKPERNGALLVALWTTVVAIVSIHTLGLLAVIAITMGALFALQRRHDKRWLVGFLKWAGMGLGLTLVLNSYWLVPLLFGHGPTAHIVDGFTRSDLHAFATGSRGFGLVGNVLGLQGFWGDSKNLFLVSQDVFSWWRVPIVLLWALVLYGVTVGLRRQRGVTLAFIALAFIGMVLSIGTAGTFFAPVNEWFVNTLPFFAGYREPQKFVALIALAYVYFGSVAVISIVQLAQKQKALKDHAQTIAFVMCLLPLLCAPLMPWGFHGQLHAAEYPVEWNAINDRLTAECRKDCKVLFLPWHLYMRYSFAGRIIADPAPKFFHSSIVASSDPELQGAAPYGLSPTQKAMAATIPPKAAAGSNHVAADVYQYDIRYILLAKENDYEKYSYLDAQKNIQVVMDTPTLKLYEVKQND